LFIDYLPSFDPWDNCAVSRSIYEKLTNKSIEDMQDYLALLDEDLYNELLE